MSEAIFVEGLTKKYGEKTVVNHLNLQVNKSTYRPTHSQKSPEKRDFVVHTHEKDKSTWLVFFN